MTLEDLYAKVSKLEEFYEKNYNITQKKVWFEALKDYSADRLEQAIDWICMNSKFKPTLADIISAMTMNHYSQEEYKPTPCVLCKRYWLCYRQTQRGRLNH